MRRGDAVPPRASRRGAHRVLPCATAALLALGLAAPALAAPATAMTAGTTGGAGVAASRRPAAATLPPPPPCPNAVARATRTGTTAPTPLPRPASTLGGPRLSRPGMQVDLPPGTAPPPAQRATAWIVVDLADGSVLASCNAHVPLAPASTLKVLTALTLYHRIPSGPRYRATDADARVDGTRVGLVPRSVYRVRDLWHGLLLGSGNDAAQALASLAGGMPAAARLMTERARQLGAADTVARNTSGLDAPGQVSSVYDLAVFGRAALADRDLAAMVTTQRYPFPAAGTNFSNRRRQYEIQNHNRLLGAYAGATGIKNGYTRAAGGSYIASARRGDRSYVVALLKTDRQTWRMARTLLDWAFRSGPAARPVGVLGTAPVAEQLRSPATGTPGATPSPSAAASPPASTAPSPVPTVSAAPAPTAGGSGSPGTGGDARGSVVAGTATGTAAGAGAGTAGTSGPPALVWLLALTAAGALVGLAASRSRGSAPRRRS